MSGRTKLSTPATCKYVWKSELFVHALCTCRQILLKALVASQKGPVRVFLSEGSARAALHRLRAQTVLNLEAVANAEFYGGQKTEFRFSI